MHISAPYIYIYWTQNYTLARTVDLVWITWKVFICNYLIFQDWFQSFWKLQFVLQYFQYITYRHENCACWFLMQDFEIFLVPQNYAWKSAFFIMILTFRLHQWGKIIVEASNWGHIHLEISWRQPHMLSLISYQTKVWQKRQVCSKKLIWFLNSIKVVPHVWNLS